MLATFQLVPLAATLLLHPVADADPPPPEAALVAPAPLLAPREYNWTFSFRQQPYGIEQYGPVATYRRNTHLIWRNRAHQLPATVPVLILIALAAIALPLGLLVLARRPKAPK
jgi:hypothetical protein